MQTIQRYGELRQTLTAAAAARELGKSIPTLWRWQKAYASGGLAALRPQLSRCGRPSIFKSIRLSASARRSIEALLAKYGKRHGWLQFATTPLCPPAVAAYVQRNCIPPTTLAHVAQLRPVPATMLISADGRRIYLKPAGKPEVCYRPKIQIVRPSK